MSKEIKLIIFDADGVLTNGQIGYNSNGEEVKLFSVKDGFFIKHILPKFGIKTAIISGGKAETVTKRAEILGIDYVYTEKFDKTGAYNELLSLLNLAPEETAYIGDDWFDWPVMKLTGFKGAPADAHVEIRERADYICRLNGGFGAAREFIEEILKREQKYQKAVELYFD